MTLASQPSLHRPRLVIAGLGGGNGKTTATLGLASAWRDRGFRVLPFKKGPDYIDATWMEQATGQTCRHLDLFMMGADIVTASFFERSAHADISLIEGNRGLFDGVDAQGSNSTAALARLLSAPVVLVVDCTKVTGTVGAIVHGCHTWDPDLELAGVILNKVATARQEGVIRQAVEDGAGVPVLGVVRRVRGLGMPQRHLGLHPAQEHGDPATVLDQLARAVAPGLDLDALLEVARSAAPLPTPTRALDDVLGPPEVHGGPRPRIGILRDSAFHFYYPENLEALERHGAELLPIDALCCRSLPPLDGLYIGGGFPETQADRLAANTSLRDDIRRAARGGLPVYAECGGLIYLCRSIAHGGVTFPMTGLFPVDMAIGRRPAGHGYFVYEASPANPFFAEGTTVRGHEFHYAHPVSPVDPSLTTGFGVVRGHGLDGQHDGLVAANTLATFGHVHALATPEWAAAFIDRVRAWR